MSVEIKDVDLGFDDFFDSIDELAKKEVEIGYTQESGSAGNIGMVDLAMIQEFGVKIPVTKKMRGYLGSQGMHLKASTTEITIPARPFMRDSFDNNETEIADEGVKLLDKYLDNKIDAELAYEVWGDFYNSVMKQGVITRELGLAENHPFTIERKGSDTPLIHNKDMLNRSQVMVK